MHCASFKVSARLHAAGVKYTELILGAHSMNDMLFQAMAMPPLVPTAAACSNN